MDVDDAPPNFTQLLLRSLSAELAAAAWCTSMDLLALVTGDGQLALHRLNWQRLWSVTPDASISALCWRPDGRGVGIGLEDGSILTYDAENGQAVTRAGVAPLEAVAKRWVAMGWVQASSAVSASGGSSGAACPRLSLVSGRLQRLFTPPPPPVPAPGQQPWKPYQVGVASSAAAAAAATGAAPPTWADALGGGGTDGLGGGSGELSLVTALDAGGRVVLCSSDLLPIVSLDAGSGNGSDGSGTSGSSSSSSSGRAAVSVGEQVLLSRSLRHLWLLRRETAASGSGAGDGGSGNAGGGAAAAAAVAATVLRVYGTGRLAGHPAELGHLLGLLTRVRALAAGLRATLDAAAKEWGDARSAFEKRVVDEGGDLLSDANPLEEDGGTAGMNGAGDGSGGGGVEAAQRRRRTRALSRELGQLLAVGGVSTSLQHYLVVTLGEANIKRLAKHVDGAATAASSMLAERLLPALEALTFELSELQGLAACRPWKGVFGLTAPLVDAAARAAVALSLSAERARCACAEVGASYRVFLSWLLSWVRLLLADDRRAARGPTGGNLLVQAAPQVGAFLSGELPRDSLGPWLGCEGSEPPLHAALPAGVSALVQALGLGPPLRQDPSSAGGGATGGAAAGAEASAAGGGGGGSLRDQAAALEAACSELCARLPGALSPGVTCSMRLRLADLDAPPLAPSSAAADGCGGGGDDEAGASLYVAQAPQEADDGSAIVVMHRRCPSASGGDDDGDGGVGGRHCLLVLRIIPGERSGTSRTAAEQGQQQHHQQAAAATAACKATAACVVLPPGMRAVQPSVYRYRDSEETSVVTLLAPSSDASQEQQQQQQGEEEGGASTAAGSGGRLSLVQVPFGGLEFVDLELPPPASCAAEAGHANTNSSSGGDGPHPLEVFAACQAAGACLELAAVGGVRQRPLPAGAGGGAVAGAAAAAGLMLRVSGPRGVAAVVRQQQVVCLIDLEEDEEQDDDDEDDDEEGEEGEEEGGGSSDIEED